MSGRVIAAAFAGFLLIARRPAATAVWIGLLTVFSLVTFGLQTWLTSAIRNGSVHFPGVFSLQVLPALVVFVLLALLLQLVVTGCINRAILRPSASSLAYLRLGRDELNLLVIVLVFCAAFAAYVVAARLQTAQLRRGEIAPLIEVLVPPILALILWPRLVLLPATIIGRGRLGFSEAWDLGGERYWSLLAMCLVNLIVVVLSYVVQILVLRLTPQAAPLWLRLVFYLPVAAIGGLNTVIVFAPPAQALLVLKGRPADQAAVFD